MAHTQPLGSRSLGRDNSMGGVCFSRHFQNITTCSTNIADIGLEYLLRCHVADELRVRTLRFWRTIHKVVNVRTGNLPALLCFFVVLEQPRLIIFNIDNLCLIVRQNATKQLVILQLISYHVLVALYYNAGRKVVFFVLISGMIDLFSESCFSLPRILAAGGLFQPAVLSLVLLCYSYGWMEDLQKSFVRSQ